MIRTLHISLAVATVVVQSYVLLHLKELLPVLGTHLGASVVARSTGIYWIYALLGKAICELLPFFAAGLFLFADILTARFSPKSQFTGEALVGNGLCYLVGYGTLLVSIGLYGLFASL